MTTDAEMLRCLNFIQAARLKTGADLVEGGSTCTLERDEDGGCAGDAHAHQPFPLV